ncbi:MAG: hypothetical protein KDA85_13785, partial [Planctomycetaceae bacterium]|nr:hypothetical protein [Planctomycetaceae bacterium]
FELMQFNCTACHDRDGMGGVGRFRRPYFETVVHVDIGDEGRFPPTLTGVGRKLVPAWFAGVLNGKSRIREHLTIRMPQYSAATSKDLSTSIIAEDTSGKNPAAESAVFPHGADAERIVIGRELMDAGCVQCHAFNGEYLPGTVGVDLVDLPRRIHPAWFREFLEDPGALKPRTRMPTFFPGGRSPNHELLDGRMDLQIEAMWAYLRDLPKQPLPQKIVDARNQNYELQPIDRPIVIRTFMPVAGTHAIAVGFPQGVHFAYDAEGVFPAQIWRHRFLDAEGTWFVRFAPPADPLGDHVATLPSGSPVTLSAAGAEVLADGWPDADAAGLRFLGYRLDENGVPEMLSQVGTFRIVDRMEPAEDGSMMRTLTVTEPAPQPSDDLNTRESVRLWLRPAHGAGLKRLSPTTVETAAGLRVSLLNVETVDLTEHQQF